MLIHKAEGMARWAEGSWLNGTRPESITGVNIDTRKLRPGELFVALETQQRDGHEFVPKAKDLGAVAAMVSKPLDGLPLPQLVVSDTKRSLQSIARSHRERFKGKIVGITGSVGKTSTRGILARILGDEGEVHQNQANLNNTLGVPLTLLGLDMGNHRFGVIEAGINEPGEMEQLAWMIQPDVTVVTNIGAVHLEGLGCVDNVAYEKSHLACELREQGFLVAPSDVMGMPGFKNLPRRRLAVRGGNNFERGENLECRYQTELCELGGCRVTIRQSPGSPPLDFRIGTTSPGMAANAALAIITALELGVPAADIRHRLHGWKPMSNRGQMFTSGERFFYVDCYNASPISMVDSFRAFDRAAKAAMPRLYILGCMAELGEDAPAMHRQAGRQLHLRPGDEALVVGDYAEEFCQGIYSAGSAARQIKKMDSLEQIKPILDRFDGAVMLKGSRCYQLERLLPENLNEIDYNNPLVAS